MLEKMGADVTFGPNSITVSRRADSPLIGVDEDCGDIPDVAMTLAVVGLFAKVNKSSRWFLFIHVLVFHYHTYTYCT